MRNKGRKIIIGLICSGGLLGCSTTGMFPSSSTDGDTFTAKGQTGSEAEKAAMLFKEISNIETVNAKVFDPSCKNLVEPYEISSNLMSIGQLGMKLTALSFAQKLGVADRSGTSVDIRTVIKIAGKNLNWLPIEAERKLGQYMHESQAPSLLQKGVKDDDTQGEQLQAKAKSMLDKILGQVKEVTPYQFAVHIRDESGNATALPGGIIHMDKDLLEEVSISSQSQSLQPKDLTKPGLIKVGKKEEKGKKGKGKPDKNNLMSNPDSQKLETLASQKQAQEDNAMFALAHEIAHVLQRHETRAIQARMTDGIDNFTQLGKVIGTPLNSATDARLKGDAAVIWGNNLLEQFIQFTKDQELQADACAVRLLDGLYNGDKRRLASALRAFIDKRGPVIPEEVADPKKEKTEQTVKILTEAEIKELKKLEKNINKMGSKNHQHPNTQARAANLSRMLSELVDAEKTAGTEKKDTTIKIETKKR